MNDFSKKSIALDDINKEESINNVEENKEPFLKDVKIKNLASSMQNMSKASTDQIMIVLFKMLHLMRLYNGNYEGFVQDQGEHPILHKLWDYQIELNQKLDEVVDGVVDINGLSKLKEMTEKDLDHYRQKADYNNTEVSINNALGACADITTDYLVAMFTTLRNKLINGDMVDTSLMSEELRYIGFQHQVYFSIYPHTDAIKNMATLLVGSELFYDDLAYEHKIRYEIDKFDACNTYGITPNSYDEYINAVQKYIEDKLNTDNDIDIRDLSDIDPIAEEAKTACRQIMKRVPNFEEDYKSKGHLVYKSLFLIRYCEVEEKMQQEFDRISPTLGKGQGSASEVYNNMLKYREGVFKRRLNEKSKTEEAKESGTIVRNKRSDVSEFLAKRRQAKTEKTKSAQNPKLEGSGGESYGKNDSLKSRGIYEQNKGISEEVSNNKIAEESDKLLKMMEESTNNKEEKEIEKVEEIKQEIVKPSITMDVEKATAKEKIELRKIPEFDLDRVSIVEYQEPDKSILKDKVNYPSFSKRRKAYLDTSKYSRSIFLINSNYNVTVNKLKDGAKLDYMVSILKDMIDADANYMVKFELIKTVYESLTFDFDVTFQDFLKNTHESDLTVLFIMFALVNAPESYKLNGDIVVDIPSLYCKKCNTVAYFKEPIKLKLKAELTRLYNKELYIERYPKYKMSNYSSLLEAYRKSDVGKLKMIKAKDSDGFIYNIVFSYPTLYKTMEVDKMIDSMSFNILLDEVTDKYENDRGTATNIDLEIYSYMNGKTYLEVIERYRELSKIDFTTEDKITREMPEFKTMQKENNLIVTILTSVDLIKSKMYYLFQIMKFIDLIEIVDEETGETLDKINHEINIMEMIRALSNIDDESTKVLMDAVTSGLATNVKNQDIEFYPEDLEGLLEWDKYYLSDSNGNILTEEQYEDYITSVDDTENLDIDVRRNVRKTMKENLENGKCTCGNSPLVVNYTSLLFFSLSKI